MNILKYIRKYIVYILFVALFFPSLNVHAVGSSWGELATSSYFDNHFGQINNKLNGVLYNTDDIKQSFDDFLDEYRSNNNISGSNSQFIADHMTINYQEGDSGNSDVSIDQTLRQVSRQWSDTYKSTLGYDYYYTFSTSIFSELFSGDKLRAFISFVETYEDDYYVMFSPRDNNAFCLIPKSYADNFVKDSYNNGYPLYDCYWYSGNTQVSPYQATRYLYNDQNSVWVSTQYTHTFFDSGEERYPFLQYAGVCNQVDSLNYCPVTLNSQSILVYQTTNALNAGNHGEQEYYVSDSYNSTISGSYNTTTNEIDNSVTNTDVNTYISNYYTDNGSYPTPNQITIYINTYEPSPSPTPTPTPDPNPGGGDDDDDDNNSNIFDFLERIGDVIAGLISALGEVLASLFEVLGGIIDMFIGPNGIPNIIGQLLGYFLGDFFPPELLTLFELFIVLGVIYGIIRLIRGH